MYNESLGRWRTADLLIGLAYLARQETAQQAVADIACTGHLVGQGRSKQERLEIIVSDCMGSTVSKLWLTCPHTIKNATVSLAFPCNVQASCFTLMAIKSKSAG